MLECLPEGQVQADSHFLTSGRILPFSSARQDSILPYNMASLKEGVIQGAMEGFVDLSKRPDLASAQEARTLNHLRKYGIVLGMSETGSVHSLKSILEPLNS